MIKFCREKGRYNTFMEIRIKFTLAHSPHNSRPTSVFQVSNPSKLFSLGTSKNYEGLEIFTKQIICWYIMKLDPALI